MHICIHLQTQEGVADEMHVSITYINKIKGIGYISILLMSYSMWNGALGLQQWSSSTIFFRITTTTHIHYTDIDIYFLLSSKQEEGSNATAAVKDSAEQLQTTLDRTEAHGRNIALMAIGMAFLLLLLDYITP